MTTTSGRPGGGTLASDLTLNSTLGKPRSLSHYRGQAMILMFYPADWSPTRGDQLALANEILPEFERLGARMIGISVDGRWRHAAYAGARNLRLPLVADFGWPAPMVSTMPGPGRQSERCSSSSAPGSSAGASLPSAR